MSAWSDFKRGFRGVTGDFDFELIGAMVGIFSIVGIVATLLTAAVFAVKVLF